MTSWNQNGEANYTSNHHLVMFDLSQLDWQRRFIQAMLYETVQMIQPVQMVQMVAHGFDTSLLFIVARHLF